MKYEFIKGLTSDVVFRAYGKDAKELFENAAEAMASVICQIGKVSPKIAKSVEVKGEDLKDLLYNWLQEIIALVDTAEMFFSRFEIEEISDCKLKAKIYGEPMTPDKGETVVKAVTYHNFNLKETENGYEVTVNLDI